MEQNKKNFILCLMPFLLFAAFIVSLTAGSGEISFFDALKALFGAADEQSAAIILKVRFPRIAAAMLAGLALGASGCVFQGILKNPLADPFTLGVSGGAAFGAAAGFVFKLASISRLFIPLCAFFGALISVYAVYLLSARKRFDSDSMILSGVIMSYIFSSAVMLLFALSSSNQMQSAFMWLMGNFSAVDERLLFFVSLLIIAGSAALCLSGNIINAIALGGEKSKTLGLDIESNIKILFLVSSVITAAAVSVCGVIGFVGLMMPHIMRRFVGVNNIALIPASAAAGAVFLPLCDTAGRTVFSPIIIPAGIITSIIGGLFFMFLLLKSGRKFL